jgi:hypothetical protein
MARLARSYDMYKVQEYFRGVLFKEHGPFEGRELADMFVGHHDSKEDGVEFIVTIVE